MSFRNHKALVGAVSALLMVSFCMFVIPEPSSALSADAGTVIIESDMDDRMPIEEIVVIYGTISAEKNYQESIGNNVLIKDTVPKRLDPKEQMFIEDLRGIIGDDRFDADDRNAHGSADMTDGSNGFTDAHHVVRISVPDEVPHGPACDDVSSKGAANVHRTVDLDFMMKAMELAEKNGIILGNDQGYLKMFSSKMTISLSYSELLTIDTSSKDTEEQTEDCIAIVTEDECVPTVPKVFCQLESPCPLVVSTVPGVYNTGAVTCGL